MDRSQPQADFIFTITASGGVLNLVGKVDLTQLSGSRVSIETASASTLEFSGGTVSMNAITINNANQTLEVGVSSNLTITGAESTTNGTILLSGGVLTDTSGLTIGSGAKLTGFGTVGTGTSVNGIGTITASGGTLEFKSASMHFRSCEFKTFDLSDDQLIITDSR